MIRLAFFIGIYSYLIFTLGLFGQLTKSIVIGLTTLFIFTALYVSKDDLLHLCKLIFNKRVSFKNKKKKIIYLLILIIILQTLVNLIGVFGPELSFDALWYHLTFPKLYLLHHTIYHIPGGLLYYSDMPKLGEMLYVGVLSFGNEILAKLLHFIFGLLILGVLYKFSRKFLNKTISLLVVAIFYANLVVDWESITAFIDLIRTFFELLALLSFVNWIDSQKWKWFILSAVMLGLAVTTKVLALGSLIIFTILIIINHFIRGRNQDIMFNKALPLFLKNSVINLLFCIFVYWFIVLIILLPWFIFSYINTGNPFFPFFSNTFASVQGKVFTLLLLNPLHFLQISWYEFTKASDPISPIYIIVLPLIIFVRKVTIQIKFILIYAILSFFFWYATSSIEGSRLLIPYLPTYSLICGLILEKFNKKKTKWFYNLLIAVILLVSIISIGYRLLANIKYLPVITGRETKQAFLTKQLNFHFGDFYDTDTYFATHIKSTDIVLLYGFHNLYYVDFPFIDSSWVKKGDKFKYIAVQNSSLPLKYKNWHLIYKNEKTMVQLYKSPTGICQELCQY